MPFFPLCDSAVDYILFMILLRSLRLKRGVALDGLDEHLFFEEGSQPLSCVETDYGRIEFNYEIPHSFLLSRRYANIPVALVWMRYSYPDHNSEWFPLCLTPLQPTTKFRVVVALNGHQVFP